MASLLSNSLATPSVDEHDEFGLFDGVTGVLQSPVATLALDTRDDLGRAIYAWLPREDLL